jgi:hypothetical protein
MNRIAAYEQASQGWQTALSGSVRASLQRHCSFEQSLKVLDPDPV